MNCNDMQTEAVCLRRDNGETVSAVAHFEYGLDVNDEIVKASTRFTDATGDTVYDFAEFVSVSVGACRVKETCWNVEATEEVVVGDQEATWIIAGGDLEINSGGGNQGGSGPWQNAAGGLDFSTDGTNFGSFSNILGGQGNSWVGSTIYFRNPATGTIAPVVITSFAGGGSPNYTGTYTVTNPDQMFTVCEGVVYDDLNNVVDALPAGAVQVKCFTPEECLEQIKDSQGKQELKRRCFERPSQFFDTLDAIDTGNRPLTDDICVFPNDSGTLKQIRLRVDNLNPFNGANSIHDTISFTFDGQPLTISENRQFNPTNPFGIEFDDAWPGITEFWFDVDIDVVAGEKYTIAASLANGPDPQITWQQHDDSADSQIEYTGAQDGNFPGLHWVAEGVERFYEITQCDGTVRLEDELGNEIDEIPDNTEPVPCIAALPTEQSDQETEKFIGKVNYGIYELAPAGPSIPIDAAAGSLPDGTTFNVSVNQNLGDLQFSADTPGDIRWDNATLSIATSAPVELQITNVTGADMGTPIIWQGAVNGGPANVITDGGMPSYVAGAFDAQLNISPSSVTATLDNPNAPRGDDDFGVVTFPSASQIDFRGIDFDAYNFTVRQLQTVLVETRSAYGCRLSNGTTVYRDCVTHEVVEITDDNIVEVGTSSSVISIDPTCKQELADLIAEAIKEQPVNPTKLCKDASKATLTLSASADPGQLLAEYFSGNEARTDDYHISLDPSVVGTGDVVIQPTSVGDSFQIHIVAGTDTGRYNRVSYRAECQADGSITLTVQNRGTVISAGPANTLTANSVGATGFGGFTTQPLFDAGIASITFDTVEAVQQPDGTYLLPDGSTLSYDEAIADGWVACPEDVESPNSHLIEGCILSDPDDPESEKLSAYTVINDSGDPLFAPRPLTDLGFTEDCC